jgi:anti-sigma factor RsiW
MEYEEGIIALMMEALDGELSAAGEAELAAHLRARPDLAAEFEKMQAVDQLLRQTPLLTPPAGFVQRTVQHLPGTRQRLWMGVLVYTVFLAAGVIPLVGLGWAAVLIVPALGQPALWSGLWQAMLALCWAQLGVILGALAGGAAQLVAEQPATIGWLLLMVLVVVVWGGVFNRLVLQQERT